MVFFFLVTQFFFVTCLDGEIGSGGMHWLDGKRLLSPWEAQEHVQVDGEALRGHRVCVSGKPRNTKFVQDYCKPAGSSRQPDPRDCNF